MSLGRSRTLAFAMHNDRCRDKFDDWNQDMRWVRFEKTTGEALLRVRTVESGNGMDACRRLHNWYGKQTDMGLAELRQRAIRPVQAQREEDFINLYRRVAGSNDGAKEGSIRLQGTPG